MKEFYEKHKTAIISVLTAILSLAVGLSKLDLGVKVGTIIAIVLVVIPILLNIITEGFSQRTIDLIVNAVGIIQKIIVANGATAIVGDMPEIDFAEDGQPVPIEDTIEKIKEITPVEFTKEQIREMLLENL